MHKQFLTAFILFASVLFLGGTEPVKKPFTLRILQDGAEVPLKKNTVTLRKKPFVLEFTIRAPLGIFVNASFDGQSYKIAKSKKPFTSIPGFRETGMAESNFNQDREIMLDDAAPSYWFYDNSNLHRFDDVKQENGMLICKRSVEKLYLVDKSTTMKLEQVSGNLYLVFLVKQRGKGEEETQLQRECLMIKWEN